MDFVLGKFLAVSQLHCRSTAAAEIKTSWDVGMMSKDYPTQYGYQYRAIVPKRFTSTGTF